MPNIAVNLQVAIVDEDADDVPSQQQCTDYVTAALVTAENRLADSQTNVITIRIVDSKEITQLNTQYRRKNKPTNILSFSYGDISDENEILLGDLAICATIVSSEAVQQNKALASHWAHLIIHGTLHLLGYDHENETDASEMEFLEITAMESLGYANPYLANEIGQ